MVHVRILNAPSEDAFRGLVRVAGVRHTGLGKPRWRLLELLAAGPSTVPELATRLRLTAGTVRYHLRPLRKQGLVKPDDASPKCWYAVRCDVTALAQTLGTLGTRDERKQQYEREREKFEPWRAWHEEEQHRLVERSAGACAPAPTGGAAGGKFGSGRRRRFGRRRRGGRAR